MNNIKWKSYFNLYYERFGFSICIDGFNVFLISMFTYTFDKKKVIFKEETKDYLFVYDNEFQFFHDENEMAYTETMQKEREYLKEKLKIVPKKLVQVYEAQNIKFALFIFLLTKNHAFDIIVTEGEQKWRNKSFNRRSTKIIVELEIFANK